MYTTFNKLASDTIPDLPPSQFDDALYLDAAPKTEPSTPPATRQAIKIARAIAGDTELRLLQETSEGKKPIFILETAQLQSYAVKRTDLMKTRKTPMTQLEALTAFQTAVDLTYPAETLRNGKCVAIHTILL